MRMLYDFSMATILLAVGIVMVAGDKFGVAALKEFLEGKDSFMRYMFGSLCLFYGGFRLYRGIKHQY